MLNMRAGSVAVGLLGAVSTAAGAARHLAWYVSYQMDGTARPVRATAAPDSERPVRDGDRPSAEGA